MFASRSADARLAQAAWLAVGGGGCDPTPRSSDPSPATRVLATIEAVK
jgi:hypothetical protein